MADEDKIKKIEAEKLSAHEEMQKVFEQSRQPETEKEEISAEERERIKEELKREIDLMDADENFKKESENKAKQIGSLDEEKKIKHLLKLAKEKGIFFALNVAKKMNDPFILDTFHDLLVREGYYKKFAK